jgi:hypothetical protein
MNEMKKLIFLITVALILTGCSGDEDEEVNEKVATFATVIQTPTNLGGLNSEYDDYNSTLDENREMGIIFSSNRNSQGNDFDLIYKYLVIKEDPENKNITIEYPDYDVPYYWKNIFRNVNSAENEFGPYLNSAGENLFLMYSTKNNAGYDIQFLNLTDFGSAQFDTFDSIPKTIPKINEYDDDLYPTFSTDKKNLIFCSNKNSNVFNIYNTLFKTEINFESLINGDIESINKIESLSSIADDKCPYIGVNDMMVFTSNREGGFGGYDIWYSFYVNGQWIAPKNFGSEINTGQDEFRPITFKMFERNFMIFSSNRPGGKGGFDLYFAEFKTE